jgi:hypothetical protein
LNEFGIFGETARRVSMAQSGINQVMQRHLVRYRSIGGSTGESHDDTLWPALRFLISSNSINWNFIEFSSGPIDWLPEMNEIFRGKTK